MSAVWFIFGVVYLLLFVVVVGKGPEFESKATKICYIQDEPSVIS